MLDTPVLRIELDRIKYSISHMLTDHNNAFNDMVKQSLDEHLSSDGFKAMVDLRVKNAANELITEAIQSAFKNDELKTIVNDAVVNAMTR